MGVGMGSLIPAVRMKSRFYHQFAGSAAFCIFDQLGTLEAWPHFPHGPISHMRMYEDKATHKLLCKKKIESKTQTGKLL